MASHSTADQEVTLTGKIARERIRQLKVPRPSPSLIEGFRALGQASSVLSDVMDKLGLQGVVAASTLKPSLPGRVMVGAALTVRNIALQQLPYLAVQDKVNGMAEFEAHNLAEPGDVLVIQGVAGVSNMGGISAQTGKRQGEVGAVIEGGIRDVAHSREVGYPVWASEITPVTGKWRIQTVEINGDVQIAGHRVRCGDIVFADDTGICFLPIERSEEILELAKAVVAAEVRKCAIIDQGVPVYELPSNA